MAEIINFDTHSDIRGSLSVFEKEIPFEIKRVFTIYNIPENEVRGQHGHKKTEMVMIALGGSVEVDVVNEDKKETFLLSPGKEGLYLRPHDWHKMKNFKDNCSLIVLCSHHYDKEDYIYECPQ